MATMDLVRAIGEDEQDGSGGQAGRQEDRSSSVDRSAQWTSSTTITTSESRAAATRWSRIATKIRPRPEARGPRHRFHQAGHEGLEWQRCRPGPGAVPAHPGCRGSGHTAGRHRRGRDTHPEGTESRRIADRFATDRSGEFIEQPRLADAGLAMDEDDATRSSATLRNASRRTPSCCSRPIRAGLEMRPGMAASSHTASHGPTMRTCRTPSGSSSCACPTSRGPSLRERFVRLEALGIEVGGPAPTTSWTGRTRRARGSSRGRP